MNLLPKFIRRTDISETAKANRVSLICYFISCLVISVVGIQYYWNNPDSASMVGPVVFLVMLFVPWILGVVVSDRLPVSLGVGRFLYILFVVLYLYLAVSDKPYIMGLAVIPMMMTSVSYGRLDSVCYFNGSVVIAWIIGIVNRALRYDDAQEVNSRIFVLLILISSAVFLVLCTYMIQMMQAKKTAETNRERDRFQAIVSIGVEKIFEYDIKNDIIMIATSSAGIYGKEHYICNISTVAKSKKYVPFADWYRFDEILVECRSGKPIVEKDFRFREEGAQSNEYIWYRVSGRVIFDEDGTPDKVIGTMKDIEEIKMQEFRQADEKMRDPLTKLYKRPYINQFIDEYLEKNRDRADLKAGMLIVDIDGYTKITEDMGLVFGEEILKNIAEDIKELLFSTELVGRIGRDEFVVFIKEIGNVKDIEEKIKEIKKIISDTYVGEGMRRKCTVSVGAALYPAHGNTYGELFENAEKALDLAQSKGPDHYDIYNPMKEQVYSLLADEIQARNSRLNEEEKTKIQASDSLIERAFKLIDESKDTDSAINLLIRQIVRQMGIDAILISERVEDDTSLRILYHCGFDEGMVAEGSISEYSQDQWNAVMALMDEGDGLIVNENIDTAKAEADRLFMLTYGIESFVGCAFYDKGNFVGVMQFIDFSRERKWNEDELKNIRNVSKVVSSYLLKMKAYEKASATVERLAGYDAVTGLYKYERFLKNAGEYIATAQHGNYAILYLDVFNFKFINDSYGYETGDRVLSELAQAVLSYSDVIVMASRVFSDNIVAIARLGIRDDETFKQGLLKAIQSQTTLLAKRFSNSRLNVGMGVCTFTISGAPVMLQNIISNANMARKRTKIPGMPRLIFYDDQMGSEAMNEVAYSNDMEHAFENREFVVYMQPRVSLSNDEIKSAEALVRWKKKDGSIIYPNDFIPVFERNKSITQLDFYVYEEVCRYLKEKLRKKEPVVPISVNVSRVHLYSIDEFITKVKGLLAQYDILPHLLEFELTETSFTDKVDDSINLMSRLRKLGVKVSLDDFGSGYSSLNVLTKLPLDILKIDKEFLSDFENDSEEKIVIPSVIEMARKLKLEVVCEGVETKEQLEFLRDIGCEYAQGYYYSKPVPVEEFEDLLTNGFR